ncbi:hypothetical protein ACFS6H_07655 [Terrimonas rubra]|uniref:Uncharacterized protein n=1 Tax=Terrimonas rubra TaxID=1035890 RepID=A0ABW6A2M3_9BACT
MRPYLLLLCLLTTVTLCAQRPSVKWGQEFKIGKGSTDLQVIHADKSGVYLQEGHFVNSFIMGAWAKHTAKLIKLDKNLIEVYDKDYNKELKGKSFMQFFALQEKLFAFASESKKNNNLVIYAAEVDKNSGDLIKEWQELSNINLDSKKDRADFKITYNTDSTTFLVVNSLESNNKNTYQLTEFSRELKALGKTINITNQYDKDSYKLEDLIYTPEKKIFLIGRTYEFMEGKKKKAKFLAFASYNISLYNDKGVLEKELNTTINGKWLNSAKLVFDKNHHIALAAFYSNDKKNKSIDGLLVQRINTLNGEVISTTEKTIDQSMLASVKETEDSEDEEETKAEKKEREAAKKEKEEDEGFSRNMVFRNIYFTNDGGLILMAEEYNEYRRTSYSYNTNGIGSKQHTQITQVYECGDIMISKIEANNNIGWIKVLPKNQLEIFTGNSDQLSFDIKMDRFFANSTTPFYAGYGSMQINNSILLFFNDNTNNSSVTEPGNKVKKIQTYKKSSCFTVTVDVATGKIARKLFFSNDGIPTAMPRLSSIFGKDMYLVGKTYTGLIKSKVSVGKITVK